MVVLLLSDVLKELYCIVASAVTTSVPHGELRLVLV